MDIKTLISTAQAMVADGKGILAIDESGGTIKKRFDSIGVESTEDSRRAYREMLLTTPGLSEHISGAILFDETLRQSTADGRSFVAVMEAAGIIPGIKVDTGAHPLSGHPGELVTEGLDGLRQRLQEYAQLGARFAKWRAVISISEATPSDACINANCHALARYAALCQEAGIVPMVEPEILINGDHSLEDCYEVTELVLRRLFEQMYDQNVMLEGAILKASMVISGDVASNRAPVEQVAEATVDCLLQSVPGSLAGVVFLSGGQGDEEATAHLDAMNKLGIFPWPLSFSYGRALQHATLVEWGPDIVGNISSAQAKLSHRARMNGLATLGQYESSMEPG